MTCAELDFWSTKLLLALLWLQSSRNLFPQSEETHKRLDLICRLQIYEAVCEKVLQRYR